MSWKNLEDLSSMKKDTQNTAESFSNIKLQQPLYNTTASTQSNICVSKQP